MWYIRFMLGCHSQVCKSFQSSKAFEDLLDNNKACLSLWSICNKQLKPMDSFEPCGGCVTIVDVSAFCQVWTNYQNWMTDGRHAILPKSSKHIWMYIQISFWNEIFMMGMSMYTPNHVDTFDFKVFEGKEFQQCFIFPPLTLVCHLFMVLCVSFSSSSSSSS